MVLVRFMQTFAAAHGVLSISCPILTILKCLSHFLDEIMNLGFFDRDFEFVFDSNSHDHDSCLLVIVLLLLEIQKKNILFWCLMINLASTPNRSSNIVARLSSQHGLLFSTRQFTKLIMKISKTKGSLQDLLICNDK